MPTTYRLSSWNTQGDFTAVAKANVINGNFGPAAPAQVPIAFLQEGGVNHTGAQGNWTAVGGAGVGAFNERCTNYILVNTAWAGGAGVQGITLQDGQQRVVVGGGIAGRSPAAIVTGRTMFVSWHSLAGSSNADTSLLITAIESNAAYVNGCDVIVIGGDFNTTPAAINTLANQGTDRTRAQWRFPYRTVVSSGLPTCGVNELDFFLVLSKGAPAGLAATRLMVAPSDHEAVQSAVTV
ncbi:MAG: hypothetical protein ABIS14_00850 [Sphingomonas sp.]